MTHTSNTSASQHPQRPALDSPQRPALQLPQRRLPPATDLDPRSIRAWTEAMTIRPLRDGRYVVETDGGTYVVDLAERTCTCPDQAIRHERCKHLRRVVMEIASGTIDAPAWGVCAACGSRVTDHHESNQGRERPLCDGCRLEPDDLVRDRETGRLLVVDTVTDDAAGESELTATGRSVADYPTNEQYGSHEPVIEAIYLGDFLDRDHRQGYVEDSPSLPARRYSFPYTRLQRVPDGRAWLADLRRSEPGRRANERSRGSADQRRRETVQTTLEMLA